MEKKKHMRARARTHTHTHTHTNTQSILRPQPAEAVLFLDQGPGQKKIKNMNLFSCWIKGQAKKSQSYLVWWLYIVNVLELWLFRPFDTILGLFWHYIRSLLTLVNMLELWLFRPFDSVREWSREHARSAPAAALSGLSLATHEQHISNTLATHAAFSGLSHALIHSLCSL